MAVARILHTAYDPTTALLDLLATCTELQACTKMRRSNQMQQQNTVLKCTVDLASAVGPYRSAVQWLNQLVTHRGASLRPLRPASRSCACVLVGGRLVATYVEPQCLSRASPVLVVFSDGAVGVFSPGAVYACGLRTGLTFLYRKRR